MDNPIPAKEEAEKQLLKVVALAKQHPEYKQKLQQLLWELKQLKQKPSSDPDVPSEQPSQFSLEKPAKAMFDRFTSMMKSVRENTQSNALSMIAPPRGMGPPASFGLPKFGAL